MSDSSVKKDNGLKNGKKSKKKIVIIVAVLLILGGIGWAATKFGGKPIGETVSVKKVEKGLLEQKIGITGIIEGTDSAEITSNLPYEVTEIRVKEGDVVEKGDILAVLDAQMLESDLKMAKNELELAQIQLEEQRNTKVDTSTASAELQVKQAKADQEEAHRQLGIKKSLLESGAIANEEYLQTKTAANRADMALEVANENLRRTKAEIQKAMEASEVKGSQVRRIEIQKEAVQQKEKELEKAYIKSPIAGTITRVNAKLGRLATVASDSMVSSRALFIVENLSDLRMRVYVSEYDIGKVSVGQKVSITSDTLNKDKVSAVVARIAPTGELKQNSTTREMVIPVEIQITGKDKRLLAGVSAQATIELDKKDNVLKVPVDALYEKEGESYVALFQEDGTVKVVKVTIGLESSTEAEISGEGIQEGTQVILNPRMDFADGDKVVLENPGIGSEKDAKQEGEQ